MKLLAPSKSQRNRSLGLFKAESLGSAQFSGGKPVDMAKAKATIRRNRLANSREGAELEKAKENLRKTRQWWKYRLNWKMVRVGDRVGKLNPRINWVEFRDGTQVPYSSVPH